VRHGAGQFNKDFNILPRGVKHLGDRWICEKRKERFEIEVIGQRIDENGFVIRRHLNETESRPIGGFA
jgi:hypothetical protein